MRSEINDDPAIIRVVRERDDENDMLACTMSYGSTIRLDLKHRVCIKLEWHKTRLENIALNCWNYDIHDLYDAFEDKELYVYLLWIAEFTGRKLHGSGMYSQSNLGNICYSVLAFSRVRDWIHIGLFPESPTIKPLKSVPDEFVRTLKSSWIRNIPLRGEINWAQNKSVTRELVAMRDPWNAEVINGIIENVIREGADSAFIKAQSEWFGVSRLVKTIITLHECGLNVQHAIRTACDYAVGLCESVG